jgi:hypothetical protein
MQVGVDKMCREAGDGRKFPATFECLYKCGRQRRAQGLVYVACIFTHGRGGFHIGHNDKW